MEHSANNTKQFQEARTKPPKVRHGGSSDSAAFLCVLCNWLLSIPYQSYCGDRACYKCLELLAQKMKQSHIAIKCPECGDKIIPDQFFPDKAATRELNALHVACPNEGCNWEGQYCNYEDHFNKCPQTWVKCTYEQCREMVLRKNMGRHIENCGFRPSRCEDYGAETTANHWQDHFDMRDQSPVQCSEGHGEEVPRSLDHHTCEQYPVPCSEGERMKTHMKEDCVMVRRTCHYQIVGCKFEGSGADLLEHEQNYVQYHLRMVWRHLQGGVQPLTSGGKTSTNGIMPHNIDTALTHVDGRISELTRQLGDNLASVQQLKLETQTHATATEDAITKLQHAVKELQDYYSDLALSVQTLQATSYNGVYIWKVPELTRRRRDAVLGKTISLYSAPFFTSRHGYKLCLHVYLNGNGSGRGTHISFFITLMKGEFDPLLPWPFKQTVSLSLLAQDGVSRDITQSFKPDEDSSSFQMPKSEMNVASGCPQFCSLAVLENPAYARADTIFLKCAISLHGIEHIP